MEQPEMSKGFWDARGMQELGAIQVPWGQVNSLNWDDISKDCLPVIIYKSSTPKAVICANRMQLDSCRKTDHQYVRECFIVEIPRLMKHSNLPYCTETIELDRKFKHKRKKLLSNTKKMLMKDIIQFLNRTKTAAEIGATHGTTSFNVNLMAHKLRKPPYNFNIPGARGNDEFSVFAADLAKEMPEYIKQPLASRPPALPPPTLYRTRSGARANGH